MKKIITLIVLCCAIAIQFISCAKIKVPNEDARKIFGKWEYLYASGGFSGTGNSSRFNTNQWVEFTDRGFFTTYEGNQKIERIRFKLELKETVHSSSQLPALVYSKKNYETFRVSGDTLVIHEEGYDAYSYVFVRK